MAYAWDQDNRVQSVTDNRNGGVTNYTYDPTNQLSTMLYPNGVSHAFGYDNRDRTTSLAVAHGATSIANYTQTFSDSGRKRSVNELGGRSENYSYDPIYRLLNEGISGDPVSANNGALAYSLDPAGNRQSLTSTLVALPSQSFTYDADDRLNTDTYDANGNTLSSGGTTYVYDFQDRLISASTGVQIVYDGDGNRVSETSGGVTTKFLVDALTPTGYAQVAEELVSGTVSAQFTYGSMRISQNRAGTLNYYGYDLGSSTRQLLNGSGVLTDTYTYDAFGNTVARTASTVNEFQYRGEPFDTSLQMYYLRARYYRPIAGRFLTADKYEGEEVGACDCTNRNQHTERVYAHHQYQYSNADPVNYIDPTGLANIVEYEAQEASSGLQAHHILERRLAPNLIKLESKLVCILEAAIIVTTQDHQPYINAFRNELPYRSPGGPPTCYTEQQVMEAIYVVYKNDKDIIAFIEAALESGEWPE